MVHIQLTDEEAKSLHEILDHYLGDLRAQISQTESYDFRQYLHQRQDLIKKLLPQLAPQKV
jgi:hypothetical protein